MRRAGFEDGSGGRGEGGGEGWRVVGREELLDEHIGPAGLRPAGEDRLGVADGDGEAVGGGGGGKCQIGVRGGVDEGSGRPQAPSRASGYRQYGLLPLRGASSAVPDGEQRVVCWVTGDARRSHDLQARRRG